MMTARPVAPWPREFVLTVILITMGIIAIDALVELPRLW